MIGVSVSQDHEIQRLHPVFVKGLDQSDRIGTAVDKSEIARTAREQHRVALTHIEDHRTMLG